MSRVSPTIEPAQRSIVAKQQLDIDNLPKPSQEQEMCGEESGELDDEADRRKLKTKLDCD